MLVFCDFTVNKYDIYVYNLILLTSKRYLLTFYQHVINIFFIITNILLT